MYEKTPTANYSTDFCLQNETSNNEIQQEVFFFFRTCITTQVRFVNMKSSGARLEVSGSWLAGRVGVGKGEETGVKGPCYVHRCLGTFLYNFLFFDPISACSPLNSTLLNAYVYDGSMYIKNCVPCVLSYNIYDSLISEKRL